VDDPVGPLAIWAAVLELQFRKWVIALHPALLTAKRRQFPQLYLPTFLQSVSSGFQFAQMSWGSAILLLYIDFLEVKW
jgi:hypothetical protein